VQAYLDGKGGYTHLAESYGITNRRQVLNWVKVYKEFGDDGLIRKNKDYIFEFKLHVIELYLTTEVSYHVHLEPGHG